MALSNAWAEWQEVPPVRDAIVFSGWSWDTFNVPERVALAFAQLGATVLYVENPISVFRQKSASTLRPIGDRIFGFRPVFLGHRLQSVPLLEALQGLNVALQIKHHERRLGLRDALFVYPWMGAFWGLAVNMKQSGHFLVRMLLDQPELDRQNRLSLADFTLLWPECGLHHIRDTFAGRACLVPHAVDRSFFESVAVRSEPRALAKIPRPRLCYLGPAAPDRLNLAAVRELLQEHPEWHFVFFGENTVPGLANAHALPWTNHEELPAYVESCEVGFMPYNCLERQLHVKPLKLWEYFALGKPVVSTPMIHLWEYEDVIYRGHSVEQLEKAIAAALSEPTGSPKRQRRLEIAREHSIEKLAEVLRNVLPLDNPASQRREIL